MYPVNGMIMEKWTPVAEGAAFELPPTLGSLAPFRDQLLVLSGLACVPTPGRPGGAHAKASTRFLTDVSPPTSETFLDAGVSMDQTRRAGNWAAHAARVARAGHRVRRNSGRLRRRIRLRLHQHDLLAQRQYAVADREQPARGVRAAVRRQRQHRPEGAARPHPAGQERPRFGDRRGGHPAGHARPGRSRASWSSTSTRFATSSVASRRRKSKAAGSCRSSITRPAFPPPTTSTCG